jgi:anti-anti-sigma factor
MTSVHSSPPTLDPRSSVPPTRSDDPALVRLTGEHDLSTVAALSMTLSRAIHDGGNLAVDMRKVTFLDASTVGVLVQTQRLLHQRSRSLTVHSPSTRTRRILEICDLADLIHQPDDPETNAVQSRNAPNSARSNGGEAISLVAEPMNTANRRASPKEDAPGPCSAGAW